MEKENDVILLRKRHEEKRSECEIYRIREKIDIFKKNNIESGLGVTRGQ